MSEVVHVILVPKRANLLKEGECGSRAPMMVRFCCFSEKHFAWGHIPPGIECGCPPIEEGPDPDRIAYIQEPHREGDGTALVLAYNQKLHEDGIAWLGGRIGGDIRRYVHRALASEEDPLAGDHLRWAGHSQIGTILRLDADGKEVGR